MKTGRNKSSDIPSIERVLEDVLGCKWTLLVLRKIGAGRSRPGALTRETPGLTAKVLNQRLRKLLRFRILTKKSFSEIPPRVEYSLTPLGKRIVKVISELESIELDLSSK